MDELSDDEGWYVLDVMAVFLNFDELSPNGNSVAYLLDSHFLNATNNRTVSQAVVKTVQEYGIDYDDIRVFNSDNVAYMKKAFCDTLSCLFPFCIHITCHSHIVNLVASDFEKGFKEVTEFVKCFRNLFFVPSGRKSRFLNFLQRALNPGDSVTMPPNPTTKSWSAWFDSVLYHAEFYFLFEDFVQEELNRGRNAASNSLLRLEEMYQDEIFMKKLRVQLAFLKVKAPTLMVYLNYFQERMPHATQAHEKMESLLQYLHANTNVEEEDLEFCFEGDFTCQEKKELMCLFNSAFDAAHAKLCKYFVDGAQPASKFLEQIRVLDPRNLIDVERNFDSIDSIPGFEAVSRDEGDLYVNNLGPSAVKYSKDGNFDLTLFWKSKASNLPELYKLASCYCTTTIGSYDVERSFSAYNEILDEKRRSLDESTIKAFHFLNWNLRVKSSNEQERERQSATTTTPSCKATNESQKVTPKENPVPGEARATTESQKVTPKENPVPSEASEFPRLFNVLKKRHQHPQPVPQTKNTSACTEKENKENKRKKTDGANSKQSETAHKRKKASDTPGTLYRSSLDAFLGVKPDLVQDRKEANTETGSDVSTENLQRAPAIGVIYGLNQSTAQRFNTQATCILQEHREPLLNCLLNGSVKFKGSSMLDE